MIGLGSISVTVTVMVGVKIGFGFRSGSGHRVCRGAAIASLGADLVTVFEG